MKIALVAPSEIPARRANTMQVMKMAQAMVALGHDVRMATPFAAPPFSRGGQAGPTLEPDWETLAHHYGLQYRFPIIRLSSRNHFRRYDYGYRSVSWAKSWGADIIYSRLPQAAAISSQLDLPTVLEMHDFPHGSAGPLLFRLFLKGSGRRRLVVITRSLAEDLATRLGAPASPLFTLVAPDGVDLGRYANLPEPKAARNLLRQNENLPIETESFLAGYTGHLYKGRGVDHMLALASVLPQVTFLLIGGEPEDVSTLREKVANLSLENVILTGFIPNADLPIYQAACDLFLMPYQNEVAASSGGDIARYLSPMKLFEYLACGRAILSSDLPVLREVLNSQNAVLLPPADIQAWAAAIHSLWIDPQARRWLGEQAKIDAGRYTWEGRAVRVLEGL